MISRIFSSVFYSVAEGFLFFETVDGWERCCVLWNG